jgi:hypothetical protein
VINMQVNRAVTGEVIARAGFDAKVLADMFATLDWSADDEIPVPDGSSAAELRTSYSTWRSELAA